MARAFRLGGALALALVAALSFPTQARAAEPGDAARADAPGRRGRAKVTWTRIRVPEGDEALKTERTLKTLLAAAVKRADFGDLDKVSATAQVAELSWQARGDVLQLTCTLVGKLAGGPGARSRISLGDRPERRAVLEKQVLTLVANGLVTRLAELAQRPR
jgi:hypothetical protein